MNILVNLVIWKFWKRNLIGSVGVDIGLHFTNSISAGMGTYTTNQVLRLEQSLGTLPINQMKTTQEFLVRMSIGSMVSWHLLPEASPIEERQFGASSAAQAARNKSLSPLDVSLRLAFPLTGQLASENPFVQPLAMNEALQPRPEARVEFGGAERHRR